MQIYKRAFPLLTELRKQAPENTQVLLLLAESLEQLKRYSEAAMAYPEDAETEGKLDEAKAVLAAIAEADPAAKSSGPGLLLPVVSPY